MTERRDVEHMLASTLRLLRLRGYRHKTIEAYLGWLRRFAEAHPGNALQDLGRHSTSNPSSPQARSTFHCDEVHRPSGHLPHAVSFREESAAACEELPRVIFGKPGFVHVPTGLKQFPVLCPPGQGQRTSSGAGAGHCEHWA